jgi:hypothetical protein
VKDGWLSVSEIIAFPDKPFLLAWARKLALAGGDHNRVGQLGKYAGRILHHEFEEYVYGADIPLAKDVQVAYDDHEALEHGMAAWLKLSTWLLTSPIDIGTVMVELPIEDEQLRVRGRVDCISNGHIFDWKSSKHIYGEAILEVAAYDYLWERAHPDEPFTAWSIVQCSHEDDSPALEFSLEASDIKRAGMVFASMIPAVRSFAEFDKEYGEMLARSTGGEE